MQKLRDHFDYHSCKYATGLSLLCAIAVLGIMQFIAESTKNREKSWPVVTGELVSAETEEIVLINNRGNRHSLLLKASIRYRHAEKEHLVYFARNYPVIQYDRYKRLLQPGTEVPVRVNPKNPDVMALDFDLLRAQTW